ncbi:hypothetical protein BH10ACI1_BH10ACI1_19210 [soil metagenome]
MPENEKEQNIEDTYTEKVAEKPDDKSSWSEDQKKRSYYYDDACGYEIYDADEEDDQDS